MNWLTKIRIAVSTFFYLKPIYGLDIYLKSGQVIRIERLKSWAYKKREESFTELTWSSLDPRNQLITVNLSEINALVQRMY